MKQLLKKSTSALLATLLLLGATTPALATTDGTWIGTTIDINDPTNWSSHPNTPTGQATIPDYALTAYAPVLFDATSFSCDSFRFIGEQTVTLGNPGQTVSVSLSIGQTNPVGVSVTTISPATFLLQPQGSTYTASLVNYGPAGSGGPVGSSVNYILEGSANNATALTLKQGQAGNTVANVAMTGSDNSFTTGGTMTLNDVSSADPSDSIALAGTLTFGSADSLAIAGKITDNPIPTPGGINKVGSGLLSLTNNNTYSLGTTITDGTLQISGAATTQLGTGPLTFNGGTLQTVFSTYTLNNNIIVASNGGALDVDGTTVTQGTATLTGPGQLKILNSDSGQPNKPLILTQDNSSYNGTLKIDGTGVLEGKGNVNSIPSVAIINDGVVQFNQGVAGVVYGGDMSGTGSVTVGNESLLPGTAVLYTGTNSYTGGTTIVGGSALVGNGDNFPQDSFIVVTSPADALNFLQTSNNTYAGSIQGNGVVTTAGSGNNMITLTGDSHTFTGATYVPTGNLNMGTSSSSLGGNIFLSGAGMLSGIGTVGGKGFLTKVTGGIVGPGNNGPGIFTNAGDYNQSGGAFLVNIQGQGNVAGVNNGELVVGGATTIAPQVKVAVNSLDGSYYLGGPYTILSTTGTLTGTFDPVVITNTALIPDLIYQGNQVLVDYQGPFLSCAFDRNGQNVAKQLFSITDPDSEEQQLLAQITSLDCPDIGLALEELSGAPYAELLQGGELATRQFVRRLYDPVRTFLAKDLRRCDPECECEQGLATWIEAGGLQSNFKGKHPGYHKPRSEENVNGMVVKRYKGHKHGFRTYGYQITAGAQMACDNTWLSGAALSYEHTKSQFHHGGDGKTNSIMGGLYSAYRFCDFYCLGDFVIGGTETKVNRHFFVGDDEFFEEGKPKNLQGMLYGELGWNYRCSTFLIQPFLGLQGGYFSYRHIREEGDDPVRLQFRKRNYGTFDTRLGVHLGMDEISSGLYFGVDLAWQYRCTEENNFLDAEFVDFGSRYRIYGSNLDPSSFEAAVNINQELCGNWSLYLTGFWQQWSNSNAYDILGGISYSW